MFVFLLLNELNKGIEAHVEKKGAEAIPLKDTLVNGDSRSGKVINNGVPKCDVMKIPFLEYCNFGFKF